MSKSLNTIKIPTYKQQNKREKKLQSSSLAQGEKRAKNNSKTAKKEKNYIKEINTKTEKMSEETKKKRKKMLYGSLKCFELCLSAGQLVSINVIRGIKLSFDVSPFMEIFFLLL